MVSMNERTVKRKPEKNRWGHQSSGARAPELWCLLSSWLSKRSRWSSLPEMLTPLAIKQDCESSEDRKMQKVGHRLLLPNRFVKNVGHNLGSVRNITGTRVLVPGHQNSGAPTYFLRVFWSLHAHLCWPCSDKTRFCVEHIDTLGKQEKFKALKPILEIKTKNCWSAWKGTRLLVPGHQNFGAPNFIWSVFSPMHAHFMLAMF